MPIISNIRKRLLKPKFNSITYDIRKYILPNLDLLIQLIQIRRLLSPRLIDFEETVYHP
jgi:hypothetical protein